MNGCGGYHGPGIGSPHSAAARTGFMRRGIRARRVPAEVVVVAREAAVVAGRGSAARASAARTWALLSVRRVPRIYRQTVGPDLAGILDTGTLGGLLGAGMMRAA